MLARVYACSCLAVFVCNVWWLFVAKPRVTRDLVLTVLSGVIVSAFWPIVVAILFFRKEASS